MITLNVRKLSEMMEASGAKIIHAHEAIRKDVESGVVDVKHQMELAAVREVDDMLLEVFLIRDTMQTAVEFLVNGLTDVPNPENAQDVYVYFEKAKAVKEILQTGM